MKDKREILYAAWFSTMLVACAWLGVNMLFTAYDEACAAKILPNDWCKWSQPVEFIHPDPTPKPAEIKIG